jgi:6-phosphogluconolactonase (cycloisomerase 2 family)
VWIYAIDPNSGQLTFAANPSLGSTPANIAFSASGKSLYVTDNTANQLRSFTSPPGALTVPAKSTSTIGVGATSLAADPQGRFAYVANLGAVGSSSGIASFALDPATGALSAGPMFAASGVQSIAADPTGRFIYSANSSQSASAFSVDPSTGALSKIGADLPAGSSPQAIAISK